MAMSLRIATEVDYRRLEKACNENNTTDVKALCREAAMDLNRRFVGSKVSTDSLR